jgi:hypothetical protein
MRLPASAASRRTSRRALASSTMALIIATGGAVAAQGSRRTAADAEPALVWNPTLALTGISYDSNIFNQPDDPQGDLIVTFGAGVSPSLKIGDATITGESGLTYRHFNEFESERGVDGRARGQLALPLNRMRLLATGSYINVRERLNFEVDERARRVEHEVGGGAEFALTGLTTLSAGVLDRVLDFDSEVATLARTLNRNERLGTLALTHALTPLTSIAISGEIGRHRFEASPLRNGTTTRLSAGTRFAQGALVEGQWAVGWKRSTVSDPTVAPFSGLTADADLYVVVGPATRIGLRGRRDVTFSSDSFIPYYVETSVGGSVTYAFAERWDIDLRALHVWLDDAAAVVGPGVVNSNERINVLGAGIGYRLWGRARLGVYVETGHRRSHSDLTRNYDTTRVYTAISQPVGLAP